MKVPSYVFFILFFYGCKPFVTDFPALSDPLFFTATNVSDSDEYGGGEVRVLTWNIRFGVGRFSFFGDSCGEKVIADAQTIEHTLNAISDTINAINADIVFLQEVDIESKRTGYWNQIQYLLDNTYLNYGVYASMWEADFVPTDGIGRINTGNAILSRYKMEDGERIQLRKRTDQSSLVQYFYLRRNILKVKIPQLAYDQKEFFAVNIHAAAFATDNTKQQHINKYIEILDEINLNGDVFVTGGDLNAVPPGAIIDYCDNDVCEGERYHQEGLDPYHKEGSYFQNFPEEPDILLPLYNRYRPAIDSTLYNSELHFTHAPSTSMLNDTLIRKYDRKLDYLFTNGQWELSLSMTHQLAWALSDHMPISGVYLPLNN